jgi:hypothetical protein
MPELPNNFLPLLNESYLESHLSGIRTDLKNFLIRHQQATGAVLRERGTPQGPRSRLSQLSVLAVVSWDIAVCLRRI